jgi:hypothetical protein
MANKTTRPKGFRSHIDTARKLKGQSVAHDVSYMSYLVELEKAPEAWERFKGDHFKSVIQDESLGPWERYKRFRAAWNGKMIKADIRMFGAEVTCRLMGLPIKIRNEAIPIVKKFCRERKGRPTYQWIDRRLSEYLTGKSYYQKRKDRLTTNLKSLEKHVGKLEGLLRKNNIPVPLRPRLL